MRLDTVNLLGRPAMRAHHMHAVRTHRQPIALISCSGPAILPA